MPNLDIRRLKLVLLERLRPGELQRVLLVAALIGVGGALATIGFRLTLTGLETLALGRGDSLVQAAIGLAWWQRLLYPALGGLCAGLLLQFANARLKAREGSDYMEAIALGDGRIDARLSLMKAASSALSVASGGSIGREGSMVQLAALVGSLIGRVRHIPKPRLRLLVACGAAAGITAAYNAPIAGALFVAEIVLRSVAIDSLVPLLVASVMANLTVHQFFGFGPVYHMPELHLNLGTGMAAYAVQGVLAGLAAPVFLIMLDAARKAFGLLHWPLWLKLGVGGLIVGAISTSYPAVWGNGYSIVNAILQGDWGWRALLAILFFKMLATSATTGSGAVGGVFTPTLFVGAVIGALFGGCVLDIWPAASPLPAYIAVGMGAFLAAATHAPLMATLMIFEMTGNYDLIVPLMLASLLAYLVSRVIVPRSIYSHSLPSAPSTSFATLSAADIVRSGPPTVRQQQPVAEVEREFLQRRWPHVYVIDADGRFCGAVSVHDFAAYMRDRPDPSSSLPPHLLQADYPRVTPDMGLGRVLEVFSGHTGERLPMVDANDRLTGFLSKTDLMLLLGESVGTL